MAAVPERRVAVIGAGPAGLVAAKSMVEAGLSPLVFDKQPGIGGLWNPNSRQCWDSLKTNNSRHIVSFSDFPWDAESCPGPLPLNPSRLQMFNYLDKYTRKFLRPEHFALGSEVKSVSQRSGDGKWVVHWSSLKSAEQQQKIEEFDFVVFAAGVYGTQYIPSVPGLDGFKGEVLHSSQYYNPEKFLGKRVVVVGTSFSSTEVAAEIALSGSEVINIGRRRVWVLPRIIAAEPHSAATSFVPLEVLALNYSKHDLARGPMGLDLGKQRLMMNKFYRAVCGDQGLLTPDPEHDGEPPYVATSDTFIQLVRSSQIDLRVGTVREVRGSDVILDDGSVLHEIDFMIFCTGYRMSFPYLSKEVLDAISFSPADGTLPVLLDRGTFHPSVPGSAFLACYGGTSLLSMELQARWAAAIFSGALPPVPHSVQLEGIAAAKQIRDSPARPQLPYEDYMGFAFAIATELDIMPSPEFRAAHDLFIPAHFRTGRAAETFVANFENDVKELMDGKMVPLAVFRSLAGKWNFQRRIENQIDPAQSGTVTGTASFTYTGPAATEHLYSETGELVLSGGAKCQVDRKYVYVYDALAHRIDVYFESDGARGALFHSLHFLPRESPTAAADARNASRPIASSAEKGWRAEGQHLSVKDVYSPSYLFQFSGNTIVKMEISHAVDGPQKKFTTTATYVR